MKWSILGVPSSIGARNPGVEQAPAALRRAGLVPYLRSGGTDVEDDGDLPLRAYSPDGEPTRRRQQNLPGVVDLAREVALRVESILRRGRIPLVLGGDCTIALGTFAGAARVHPDPGLAYFDRDAELNTPQTTRSGILDGMVIAHLLGRGAPELAGLEGRVPLLKPGRLALLGVERLDPPEVPIYEALPSLRMAPPEIRRRGPAGTAEEILSRLAGEHGRFWIHLDLDVLDGGEMEAVDFPAPGGLALSEARELLGRLVSAPGLVGVEVTNFNPERDADGSCAVRVVDLIAGALPERDFRT